MSEFLQINFDWALFWAPTGQCIDRVVAPTGQQAIKLAPLPYSKYKGEIYAEREDLHPGKQYRITG